MKKMILVLAVLLMTAPAMAGVVVSAADTDGEVTISYDANGTGTIRAFALNIEVDGGATIDGINDLSAQYDIYPGSIVIAGTTVTDAGTPVCDAVAYPGTGTLGGLGTAGITIEMGSLAVSGDATGVLCTLTLSGSCNVSISENTARAGVVMEDTAVAADATLKGCAFVGGPACWSSSCQALGDATGDKAVNIFDLAALKTSWLKSTGDAGYNPCADFDRSGSVNIFDLAALKTNWLSSWTVCP